MAGSYVLQSSWYIYGLVVLEEKIAVAVGDVLLYLLSRQMIGVPLMRVAGSNHGVPATVNEAQNSFDITRLCFSNAPNFCHRLEY